MVENRTRLLWAGFLFLIATGVGFGVRAGLLAVWSRQYGFTMTELGEITGGGLLGFGLVILIAGLLVDALGYKLLLVVAFLCHVVSAVMLFMATPIYESSGQDATYQILFWSAILFSVGNGLGEGVINPLTAAIYPDNKTHYLNILHAGWPGGLVIGGLIALLVGSARWELLLASYLIPAAAFGYLVLVEKFPQTDKQKGSISYGGMLANCIVPFFLFLLIVHAMVGYVELGTDSWITKITGSILANPLYGTMLFVYTSSLMFALRFFAGPIVHRISPLGLLFVSAVVGATGLFLISNAEGLVVMVVAVTVYALGKTFLWPTMLGVVGDRFPQSATVAMALIGFAGMTSAGLLGGPGIGYKQDRFATQKIKELSEATYDRYKAADATGFLFFEPIQGLDGRKVGVVTDVEDGKRGVTLDDDREIAIANDTWETDRLANLRALYEWWQENKQYADADGPRVEEAGLFGGRMAIKVTALVPVTMAVCYLLMILGFKAKGGYKAVPHE